MLWIVITVLCAVAVGVRISTLSGRPQIWWLAFTGTLVFIVAGAGFLMNEAAVNAAVAVPNIAYVLSNLSFTAAAGAVQIYVHSLRRESISGPWVAAHAATAVLVGVVVAGSWWLAPIHTGSYATFREVPFTWEAFGYDGVFHLYLGAVLANVAVCAARLLLRPRPSVHADAQPDLGRSWGLGIIAAAASVDVVAHLLYLVDLAEHSLAGTRRVALVADVLTLLSMLGIVTGTVTFLLVPAVTARIRARRLRVSLQPLWEQVVESCPEVRLPQVRLSPALQVERMIIEISDGLRRLTVPSRLAARGDVYLLCASTLLASGRGDVTMASVLPVLATRRHEEEVLLGLATALQQVGQRIEVTDDAHAS